MAQISSVPARSSYGDAIDSMIQLLVGASILDNKQDQPPISPKKHALSKLPCELWSEVLDHVDVQDVMSLRLAASTWAFVGQQYMFKTFVMRPDRDDFTKFDFIAKSDILKSVKGIRLELGTLNVNSAIENLAFAYLEEHNELRAVRPDGVPYNEWVASFEGKSTLELDGKSQEAMEEYAAWNSRWHEAQQDFRESGRLQEFFGKITTLDRVEMSYKACPFRSELLMNAWIQGTHNYTFNRKVKEFRAVLTALKQAGSEIKHFSHDSLPWIAFIAKPSELLELVEPLEDLESIRLTFDSTETPHARFWAGLGIVLKSMPKLKEIHIGFAPFQSGYRDHGTWQDSLNAAEWYVPLQSMFGGFAWKELRKLRLEGLVLCEAGMSDFFDRHAKIQVLDLHNIALWQGTFQSLLTSVVEMQLRKFHMWGSFSAFHSTEELWRVDPGYDIENEGWSTVFKKFIRLRVAEDQKLWQADSNMSTDGIRSTLENFVLQELHWYGVDPWPITTENGIAGDRAHLGRQRNHNSYCSRTPHTEWPGCIPLSPEEMGTKWESLIKFPIGSSRDYGTSFSSDIPGVGEPQFATFYSPVPAAPPLYPVVTIASHTPVDIFGFDSSGFVSGNLLAHRYRQKELKLYSTKNHFQDLMDDWSSRHGHISAAVAYRMMLDGVLGLITRYTVRSKKTGVAKDLLSTIPQDRQLRLRILVMGLAGRPENNLRWEDGYYDPWTI